jgi:plasmid stabilization system protein ParE
MGVKVRLHRRAQVDLQSIRDYPLQHTTSRSAEHVRRHLMRKIAQLATAPQIGTATSNPKIRILPPTRFPYRVYYTITDEAVVILHVRHSARQDPDAAETSD